MAFSPSPSGPHRKRCRRYNEPGHAHYLTFSCFRRHALLARDRTRTWFLEAVDLARRRHPIHVWAYVIMPEHVHLLLWPTADAYDMSAILNTIKQSVSKKAILFVRRSAREFLPSMMDRQPNGKETMRFWQRGGGYDRNLWEPASIWDTIDYIHANPVRWGLCQRVDDWLWSSAREYLSYPCQWKLLDRTFLPSDPRLKV
jgi:REP-associated tyrosine transposase